MNADTHSPQTPADHEDWLAAWSQALEQMELDADRVEQVLAAAHRGAELPDAAALLERRWSPPTGLGPLPHPLLRRAQELLLRQQQLAHDVHEASALTRRHLQAGEVLQDRSPAPAVYLDVAL